MSKKITKRQLKAAIQELAQYARDMDIDISSLGSRPGRLKSFDEFIFDQKLDEILERLANGDDFEYKYFQIENIVVDKLDEDNFLDKGLLLEWQQYKNIPKTNLTYRYDPANTNTKTKDHIHVYQNKNQLYAINKDGTPHDGSRTRLGSKERKFLKSIGFTPPKDGILEWITLDNNEEYVGLKYELLFD